jgi:ATP-dependent Lhr-like helicase
MPVGLPEAFLRATEDALGSLFLRWARTHVPFLPAELSRRYGLAERAVAPVLHRLAASGQLVEGAFRPGGSVREYCHAEVLRLLRRKSLAALRKEIEPVPAETLARFLPSWQGVGAQAGGQDRLLEVIAQLQGCPLPASVLERDVLPARVRDYTPGLLDQLVSMGVVVWLGHGTLGASDGRVALYLRTDAARLIRPPASLPDGDIHAAIRAHLERRGASFFQDLYAAAGGGDDEAVLDALWDMVWAGEVTNDTLQPLRTLGPRVRRSPRRPLMRIGPPGSAGRWSLVADLLQPKASDTEYLHALANALLQRHGVLTREAVLAEGVPGGFATVYPVLRAMEEAGRIRRGYFIDGLGGSQFALPGAVDRLRAAREPEPSIVALAATDTANPYGATLEWPRDDARMARQAGAYVVLDSGQLRAYLERGGRSLWTAGPVEVAHLQVLARTAVKSDRLEILTVDGGPVKGSALEGALREAGFGSTPRGLVLWPERRPAAHI